MLLKKVCAIGMCALLVLSGSCRKSDDGNPVKLPIGTAKSFGAFRISLKVQDGITAVHGLMYDGPTPAMVVWEEVQKAGCLRLLKPRVPFCDPSCAPAICVENNICQPEPTRISVGTVIVNGLKTGDGTTTFAMDTIDFNYVPDGVSLNYPPFSEGDAVSLSATGSESSGPFTLTATGISPLVLLNETIPCINGQPIDLRWVPPTQPGNTTISILIDITFHGGTKAKIEGECDDNGSLTIPASLLDKLKTYGISGFPKIEIGRLAVSADTVAKAQLVIESKVTRYLVIPGIISCNDSTDCPDGQTCADDYQCRPIKTP